MSTLAIKSSNVKTTNPYTEQIEKEFDTHTKGEVESKLEKAEKAYQNWKNIPVSERSVLIAGLAKLTEQRKEELAIYTTTDMGKPIKESRVELDFCINIMKYYAENAEKFLVNAPLEYKKAEAYISHQPLGVILGIQPWNFPYSQVFRLAIPNIAAGNVIVLKHASNVPQCALAIEDLFKEAGFPEGVYTNLFLNNDETTELISDKRIKGVSLTGSDSAGAKVAAEAAKHIKKSILELGGMDPLIILDDVELDTAVKAAVNGRFRNAGQTCTSAKRIIVQDTIYDEFLTSFKEKVAALKVGNPTMEDTEMGPVNSEKAMKGVLEQIEKSIREGATLELGGKRMDRTGFFVEPTIITNIKKGNTAYEEEIFGPVACVFKFQKIDEAIALANDCKYGLGGGIYTGNPDKGEEIALKIETGMVYINHPTTSSPELPFGGVKNSGYGRELSHLGIREFLNEKLIVK